MGVALAGVKTARASRLLFVKISMQRLCKQTLGRGMQYATWLILVAGLCLASTKAIAQAPVNDNFADAIVLVGNFGSVTGSTVNATGEIGEPNHAARSLGNSIWYVWTAPADGQVLFNTFGSDYDTLLGVYTGTAVNALQAIGSNDDFDPNNFGPSGVKFYAQAGQTYYVAVDGFQGLTGEAVLGYSYSGAGIFQFTATEYFGTPTEDFSPSFDIPLIRSSIPGVRMTVTRLGGSVGRVLVDYSGAATGTLIFDDHEQSKSLVVNGAGGTVTLSNPRLADGEPTDVAPPTLGATSAADVTIYVTDPSSPTNITFAFERAHYAVREDEVGEGQTFDINIYVNRFGDGAQTEVFYKILTAPIVNEGSDNRRDNVFELSAGSDYATPLPLNLLPYGRSADFYGDNDKLSWGQNDFNPKAITLTITNDNIVEFNEDIYIQLFFTPKDSGEIREFGEAFATTLTILHDDLPAGSVDPNYNPDRNLGTVPPNNPNPGANGVVYSTVVTSSGSTLIGGSFTAYNTVPRNRIARINADGSIDTGFDPGTGANSFITSLALESSGKILVGGGFTSFNGNQLARIARLGANGAVDGTFNPGTGANGTVWAVAAQSDGKILIGGEFTSVNGVTRNHIARLNSDGSLDATFDPGVGPDSTVNSILVTGSGAIVIGGEFTTIAGTSRPGVARLTSTGSLDATFNPGAGADGPVYALALQGNQVLVGGAFVSMDLRSRRGLARLNSDGSLDENFDIGTGANDTVYTIALQNDGRILVGGIFTTFNQTRRVGLVRLFSYGTVDTSFLDTAYNDFAGVINLNNADPHNFIFSVAVDGNNDVMIGGGFKYVGGGRWSPLIQPEGHDLSIYTRGAYRVRNNIARLLGGQTPGPGNIELAYPSYQIDENTAQLYVTMMRTNGELGPVNANFQVVQLPSGPGAAVDGVDYANNGNSPNFGTSYSSTRMRSDGLSGPNFNTRTVIPNFFVNSGADDVYVNIFDNPAQDGNRSALLQLSSPSDSDTFLLGGENIPIAVALGRSSAPMLIVDNDTLPGTFSFSAASYIVNENGTNAVITVTRTNGSTGNATVKFQTSNGTALAGSDYVSTNGTLTFLDGQTAKSFGVRITDDSGVEPDETINLTLSNPTGGASIGLTNALLTVIDNDFPGGKVSFTAASFATNENAVSAAISVQRLGSSAGTLTVYVGTTNGSATAGVDYTGATNLLTWANGDTSVKTFVVPLLDDALIESDETVSLRLFNPTINGVTNQVALGATSNATFTIVNDDFLGTVAFSTAVYSANENSGAVGITVVRSGGSSASISVNFAAVTGTAISGVDFVATNGTLSFGPGEVSKTFTVPIIDNQLPDAARFITLSLSGASPVGGAGSPSAAIINLVDDESVSEPPGGVDTDFSAQGANDNIATLALQPDGKIVAGGEFTAVAGLARNHIARFDPNGVLDLTFSTAATNAGANAKINALVCQTDGRILIGGDFISVVGASRSHFARLNYNGSVDSGFDPGSGTDGSVFSLAESFVSGARIIFLGGNFTSYNGTQRRSLARVDNAGNLDAGFNPQISAGATVYAVVPYPTNSPQAGKVLIAGDFSSVNGAPRAGVARLNADGSVDLSFNPGSGANSTVRALALQADGRVLIGGAFTNFNGTALNRIARLNNDGSRDTSFFIGEGADDTVLSITVQADTKIVLGGLFTRCNGVGRNRITRLNNDGTVDPTINFGAGANNFVAATAVQPDGKIVIGGGFTEYDGTPRQRLARIYGGSIAGSGTLEFTAADYQVLESATNAVLTVRRRGGTAGATPGGSITVDSVPVDGTALNGVHYVSGTTTLTFPEGEVFQTLAVTVIDNPEANEDRTANFNLGNILPLNSAGVGNQTTATLTIVNDDSAISFDDSSYLRNESSVDGQATITIIRTGATTGTATVDFTTTTNGTATAGFDYTPTTNLVVFAPGETEKNVTVAINNDTLIEGSETVGLALTNANGALLLSPDTATLTIVDDDAGPGQIAFAASAYATGENNTNAVITLVRSNGNSGVVSVKISTADVTTTAGLDYVPQNLTTVSFGDGETAKTLLIPVLDDGFVEGDEIFNVTLAETTGGATILGTNTVPATIIDNDGGFSFSSPIYVGNEANPLLTVTVLRLGGTNGAASVRYSTTNITAQAGSDFTGVTNVLLSFANGETLKTFTVPITADSDVEGDETFGVVLSNPSSGMQLLTSFASASILDDDTGFTLSTNAYVVDEGATNLLVTVYRTNANTGPASVSLTSTNGSAIAGQDYGAVGGSLNFTNGESVKVVQVTIVNDLSVEGDEDFQLTLSSPSPGAQLVGINNAGVTITDNDAAVRFGSPSYAVNENGVTATITVLREAFTNSTVSVSYSAGNGTASAGSDYVAASGQLVFTNGETVKTFNVQVIDDTVEEGPETILLSLLNPVGQAALVDPVSATLTIVDNDGGSILNAGSLLTAESGPVNGAIDPGETVTVLFAMRNVSGVDTTNLVATLLATNGITSPSAATNYGVLVNNGASVSRLFSFTASGTNGGTISATFQVQEQSGGTSYGRVTFTYVLGTGTTIFSNNAAITINDNGLASPYPASITVTGLVGTVSKVTALVTNLYHPSPDDIDLLLVGPTGTNTMLMSDCGGGNSVTNLALTFDDAAGGTLPDNAQIVSGTYKPSNFLIADLLPAPAPAAPWGNTLAAFNGSNPNGTWSLYIVDDLTIFSGGISRGWQLAITTLGTFPAATDLSVKLTSAASTVVQGSNITYTVTVTNHGPWAATGIRVTNAIPAGSVFATATPSVGSVSTNSGAVVWTIGSLTKDASATASIVVVANTLGAAQAISTAIGVESDPNLLNSSATNTTTVVAPSADLAIGLTDSPDPLYIVSGSSLTYTITVTNFGPATANAVSVTNTLPAGVTFVTATPSGAYTVAGNVVTFTNLGNLAFGGSSLTATITVQATIPGTLTNTVVCGSTVADPLKGNNAVSVKTVVDFPQVNFARVAGSLVISWPVEATGYTLESATNLTAPIIWTPVTVPAAVNVGGVNYVTNNIGTGSRFFRLRAPAP